ncbi:DUF948 domain-containing protein [Geomesophilobacter sediminis]|uniref:DUF948 domain-containing protein n=1 Tax=Geomesophilobacter sediminis TaxID=2798584 RepID=A0A8J7M0Y4_9BACT|nr:DUF948 domain-containing protein [Geomesophilobacter sediminis]MBJ6726597.1 DUF948 domain-containing protein [Geomesophilobacter sediminis]
MLVISIATAITAITLVVLTAFTIPVLLELKKAAISVRTVSETFNTQLKPLIEEMYQTVADIHELTSAVAANAEGVGLLAGELGQAGENIRMINRIASGITGLVSGSSLWLTGAKVAGRFIMDRISKKRG